MICPYCGRETKPKEVCDHCGKPTEFVNRSAVQPGPIPGMISGKGDPVHQEEYPRPQRGKGYGYAVSLFVAVILLVVVAWLISFHMAMVRVLPVEETVPTLTQTEPVMVEETVQVYQIVLESNAPEFTGDQTIQNTIIVGEKLPVLSNLDGYTFVGWNTNPNGLGTYLRPGDQFVIPITEDLTLYGQWERTDQETVDVFPDVEFDEIVQLEETEITEESDEIEETENPVETESGE